MCAKRKLQKSHESVGNIIDICTFFSARLMEKYVSSCVNTGTNHAPCLNHFQTFHSHVILTRQSSKGKKNCIKPCEIMTDNQNMSKATIKDVHLKHLFFKRASRMSEMYPKTLFFFVFVCSFFFFKIDEPVSKQDFR